jgi:hypothetical protein
MAEAAGASGRQLAEAERQLAETNQETERQLAESKRQLAEREQTAAAAEAAAAVERRCAQTHTHVLPTLQLYSQQASKARDSNVWSLSIVCVLKRGAKKQALPGSTLFPQLTDCTCCRESTGLLSQ